MTSPEPGHLVRRFAARKHDVRHVDRDDRAALGQRSVSLTALHAGAPLEPRMAQLETLEAKMASIEVSLSTARRKKPGGSLGSARSHSQLDSPQAAQQTGRSHSVMETSSPAHEEAVRLALRDTNEKRLAPARLAGERERLARLRLEMDGKRLAIKNLKLALTRLHVTDNIDVRIQQAELEFQLGREELNLLTCLEQSRALTVSLEEAGRHAAADTATLHAALAGVAVGQLVSLHACALRCAGSSLKFGAAQREGSAGLWIQWAASGCGLDKGDRIVEVNGVCALQRSKEQLQRLLAAAEPALLVVMRCTADRAATLASNVRLTHRISYLEDQVAQLLSAERPAEPERPGSAQAVFQKGRVTALVAEPEMHSTTLHVRAAAVAKATSPGPVRPHEANDQRPMKSQDFKEQGPIRTQYAKEVGLIRTEDFKQQGPMRTLDFKQQGPMRSEDFKERIPMRAQEYLDKGPLRSQEYLDKGSIRSQEYLDKGPLRSQEYLDKGSMRSQEYLDKGPMRSQEYLDKGPMRSQEYLDKGPMRSPEYLDKGPMRSQEYLDKGPMRSQELFEKGPMRSQEVFEKGPMRSQEVFEKGPMRSQEMFEKGPMRSQEAFEKGPMRSQEFEKGPMRSQEFEKGPMRSQEMFEKGPMRYESKTRLFTSRADALSDNRLARGGRDGEVAWRQAEADAWARGEARLRDDLVRLTARKTQAAFLDHEDRKTQQLTAFLDHEDRKVPAQRRQDEAFRAASARSDARSPGAKSLDRGARVAEGGWASDRYASDSGRPPPPRKPARLSLHKALSLSSVAALGTAPRKPAKRRHKQAAPPAPRQEKWC